MFGLCGWKKSRKDHIDRNSKHYAQVQKNLSEQEQVMLELIYQDLAARNKDNLLTYENFLLFFGLTGLWGAKLFRQFDEDGRKLISKEQFFYGLSRTAKAPYNAKVKLLFNFFKDQHDNGIKLSAFTKMLYNYSRDQLKEIIVQDLSISPELTKQIRRRSSSEPSSTSTDPPSSPLLKYAKSKADTDERVIEVDYEENETPKQEETSFERHYARFSEYKDPGTIVQLRMNDLRYKVNYCNMITLVKEFAKNIFKNYCVDPKDGIFTFEQFQHWIRSHNQLFRSYYTAFHVDLWAYSEGEPNYLHQLERSFTARTLIQKELKTVHTMLVGDILILTATHSSRRSPTKVVCLDGLNMTQIQDQNGFGIRLQHRDEYYTNFIIYLKSKDEQRTILQQFQLFEGDTLYDLYDVHEMIGTGKFSIVYRCTHKESGRIFALKDISTQKLTAKLEATIDNESEVMKILSHPQVVKYNTTIRSKEHIYIVAQYVHGRDLYEYVRKKGRLSEYVAAFLIGKIFQAVRYLHSLDIIHRDLKPQNIMVTFKGKNSCIDDQVIENVKIIDFGLANHQSEINTNQSHGLAGTPNYIPPETILRNQTSCKGDIFSIGSILYFLLSGNLAFAYKNVENTLLRTARGEYDLSGQPWDKASQQAIDLVRRLLDPDPESRIDLQSALNHKWFQVVTGKVTNPVDSIPFTKSSESCAPIIDSMQCVRSNSTGSKVLGEDDIFLMLQDDQKSPSKKKRTNC